MIKLNKINLLKYNKFILFEIINLIESYNKNFNVEEECKLFENVYSLSSSEKCLQILRFIKMGITYRIRVSDMNTEYNGILKSIPI